MLRVDISDLAAPPGSDGINTPAERAAVLGGRRMPWLRRFLPQPTGTISPQARAQTASAYFENSPPPSPSMAMARRMPWLRRFLPRPDAAISALDRAHIVGVHPPQPPVLDLGIYTGLGVTAGEWEFDNWLLKHYRGSVPYANCPTCEPGCLFFYDDFGRSDSSTPGCQWIVATGSAAIETGKLALSSGAVAISALRHPEQKTPSYLEIFINSSSNGGKLRAIINQADADNYHCAEATMTSTGIELRLYRRVGGSETLLYETESTPPIAAGWLDGAIMTCCISPIGLSATLFSGDGEHNATLNATSPITPIAGGDGVGLSCPTGAVQVSSFAAKRHAVDKTGCPSCSAVCGACHPTPPANRYRVNLGVGGLSPNNCAACLDIHGEYLLDFLRESPACLWSYVERDLCFPGGDCVATLPFALVVTATLAGKWIVGVSLSPLAFDPAQHCFGFPSTGYNATYWSPDVAADECRVPQTLTKVFETGATSYGCSGTLPNTITLEPVED